MADDDGEFDGPMDAIGGFMALAGMLGMGGSLVVFVLDVLNGNPIGDIVEINMYSMGVLATSVVFIASDDPLAEDFRVAGFMMGFYAVVGGIVLGLTGLLHEQWDLVLSFVGFSLAYALILGGTSVVIVGTTRTLRRAWRALPGTGSGTDTSSSAAPRGVTTGADAFEGGGSTDGADDATRAGDGAATDTPSASRPDGTDGSDSGGRGDPVAFESAAGSDSDDPTVLGDADDVAAALEDTEPTVLHDAIAAAADEVGLAELAVERASGPVHGYRARRLTDLQTVAVLVADPVVDVEAVDDDVEDALRRWAQVSTHPNVESLVAWSVDPLPWAVVERAESAVPLTGVREDLSGATLLDVMDDCCEAVRAATRYNAHHPGLAPGAVFTEPDGSAVQIGDWGFRRAVRHGTGDDRLSPFDAPEQVDASLAPTGEHTDIYRLGALGYWLFCGDPPVVGGEDSLAESITSGSIISPSVRGVTLPESLDDEVMSALATDPDDRPESVYAFQRRIQTVRGRIS